MHRFFSKLLGLSLVAALGASLVPVVSATETDGMRQDLVLRRATPKAKLAPSTGFATTQADTVYVGYSAASSDPNKVGVGGVWNFDTGIAGTDSTQFWKFYSGDYRFQLNQIPAPQNRPWWYFDHGNEVNIGDQKLWEARTTAGRAFRRTGVVGVWHRDNMAGVSATIAGNASAWCGLRAVGDKSGPVDPNTGNHYNGELSVQFRNSTPPSWPGYGNQWNQILYRDITVGGAGGEALSFRLRAALSPALATESGGSGWFTPDPTNSGNFVLNPADSFMVYVGLPRNEASVYDLNRRWLSEVLDYTSATQPQKLFAITGTVPVGGGGDTLVTLNIPNLGGATTIRVAFQVHTNRLTSDETSAAGGFNSVDGAALIDDVRLNGTLVGGAGQGDFESATAIRARREWNGSSWVSVSPSSAWITTGKPSRANGHIHNVFDLAYTDPCGALGSPDRICNLINNVLVTSNHDDAQHRHDQESWELAVSPTIRFDVGNPQGTHANIIAAGKNLFRIEFDMASGTMDLDQGTFFWYSGRYMGPNVLQPNAPVQPTWAGFNTPGIISFSPDPACVTFSTDSDLDGFVPVPSTLDSLQISVETMTQCTRFASTQCGASGGAYFDNIRACFTGGLTAARADIWDLLQDTFPFNEGIAPGSANFDTTTGLIKQGLNNASSVVANNEGVMPGDTAVYFASYGGFGVSGARMDFVFRIDPGPGNYSTKGNRASALVEKNPGAPFWATYLANNGAHGTPGGHGGTWNPNVWNSARMDSGQANLSPIVGRNIGVPQGGFVDSWMHTLHEADPKFATLGIDRNICFLVSPSGPADNTNICCGVASCGAAPFFESYPPSGYPGGTQTVTKEGTKILPDGYFSPGTHIEYFVRYSNASNPGPTGVLTPDTTLTQNQASLGPNFDDFRWQEVDVLPDLWKDVAYGGPGLACILVVDAGDRRGFESAAIGALDSLGYGKNNGAGRGWKAQDTTFPFSPGLNDPANWVARNNGQKGLAFDWYDNVASESKEAGRLGCRLASFAPALAGKQCKQGPTPAMLKTYYNTIIWGTQDLSDGALHDGASSQENSDDVGMIIDFLSTSASGSERAVWLTGEGNATDLQNSAGQANTLLNSFLAASWVAENYRDFANNSNGTAWFEPRTPAFHNARRYGINNFCLNLMDVIAVNGAVAGGVEAARYEDQGHRPDPGIFPGTYTASVYRPADNVARFYSTLLDGFAFDYLRGNGGGNSQTDVARLAWMDDALAAFNLCSRAGPVIAVGDLPGADGARLNFVRGAFPNPSVTGAATVQFSLAQPAKVTLRFYNVAGRLVHEASVDGIAGDNTYRWNGATSTGMRASSGVYFYRLSAPGIDFQNNSQRMVFLGQNN